jgi:pimeloyl-ACP methyl ester carboxylesterase
MPSVSIRGTPIHYEEMGEGKTIVFVHGACENSQFWNHQRSLADRFRLLFVDLPGHGRSKPLSNGEVTVLNYAEIVGEFIASKCPEKATLVGHSMGGAITLINAIHHRDNLLGAVLVATGAKLGVLPSIREGLRTRFDETIKSVLAPRQFASTTNLEVIRFVTNEMMKCKGAIASSDYEACNGFDVRQKLATITVPTLIMVGEEDKLTPVPWSTYMKENIPKSKIIVMKGSSHLPMLERPADFNRHVTEFVTSLPA